MEPLRDGHGRLIRDVRVSVTDRCNFRCQYCMPAEGLPWLERSEVLTFEEIARLVGLLAGMGVRSLRLTGGEPLVRRDFPRLAAMLAPLVDELSVTTNGYLLERDAEALVRAGVDRFNVSVDSLQRDRFFEMTRRDALPRVLRGLEHPHFHIRQSVTGTLYSPLMLFADMDHGNAFSHESSGVPDSGCAPSM